MYKIFIFNTVNDIDVVVNYNSSKYGTRKIQVQLLLHLALHKHSSVHFRPFLTHKQEAQLDLHLQRPRALQASLTGGKVVQRGCQFSGSVHPQSSGEGICLYVSVAEPQSCAP